MIKEFIKRFRVNRGFTVHSPFAFRFIQLVVRERLPYYAFSEITDPYDRLLFRTAIFFNPSKIALVGSDAERARRVLKAAIPGAMETHIDDADFIFTDIPLPTSIPQFIQGRHDLPGHTVFALRHATIALRRHNLPPQTYPLSLR